MIKAGGGDRELKTFLVIIKIILIIMTCIYIVLFLTQGRVGEPGTEPWGTSSRGVIMERDEVGSVGKVGMVPAGRSTFHTKVFKPGEQGSTAHGIKGCNPAEDEEDVEGTSGGMGRGCSSEGAEPDGRGTKR